MNFAPVADIKYPHTPFFLESRIFGTTTEETALYVKAFIQGLQHNNIMSIVKHFPGHGAAYGDTHHIIAVVKEDFDQIMNNDVSIYTQAIQHNVAGVMLGHMKIPSIDDTHIASQSPKVIRILQDSLQFKGLVITDSLAMDSVINTTDTITPEILGLNAGVDILLDPVTPYATLQKLEQAVLDNIISHQTIERSVTKILAYKILFDIIK